MNSLLTNEHVILSLKDYYIESFFYHKMYSEQADVQKCKC